MARTRVITEEVLPELDSKHPVVLQPCCELKIEKRDGPVQKIREPLNLRTECERGARHETLARPK